MTYQKCCAFDTVPAFMFGGSHETLFMCCTASYTSAWHVCIGNAQNVFPAAYYVPLCLCFPYYVEFARRCMYLSCSDNFDCVLGCSMFLQLSMVLYEV